MEYTPQGQLHPNCLARFRVPVFERWAGMQVVACWANAKRSLRWQCTALCNLPEVDVSCKGHAESKY